MKLTKSLLLASAAGLAAVATASAADLPSKKAAPVEYVKVCPTYGPGFFYIPGTNDCLFIGGRVRSDWTYAEPRFDETRTAAGLGRAEHASGNTVRAILNIDHRSNTDYGLLRTFFRMQSTFTRGSADVGNGAYADGFALDKAFIQFGGLTAGRTQSFYDFYANAHNIGLSLGSDTGTAHVLAYTASLGNGLTATLSAETRDARDGTMWNNGGAVLAAGGHNVPDAVGVLRYDQAWGSVQASGAIHQIRTTNLAFDTEYGYAGQLGAKFNLPMIAAGDNIVLQAAYANGAPSYVGAQLGMVGRYALGANLNGILGNGGLLPQAASNIAGDNLRKSDAWSAIGAFQHYWSPTVWTSLFGGYSNIDFNEENYSSGLSVIQAGIQLGWNPVKNLTIATQLNYTKTSVEGADLKADLVTANIRRSADAFHGRIRIQRDF